MAFKDYVVRFFTWWNGTTFGTQFYTWRHGNFVGEDEFGNRYYQAAGPLIDPSVGPRRRWVVYNGESDVSKVPPGWRGWLAFTAETPPSEERYVARPWELPPVPNLTGTPYAYRPPGSLLRENSTVPETTGDYVAWSPDGESLASEPPNHSPHPGLPKNIAHG
jgi:NADH:ubiquinone oxidoreductase subunit